MSYNTYKGSSVRRGLREGFQQPSSLEPRKPSIQNYKDKPIRAYSITKTLQGKNYYKQGRKSKTYQEEMLQETLSTKE